MTTNTMHESKELLPEHAPRLDWMKLAPEVYRAMIRLDTADETELAHLVAAITTINAFNRFGVSTRMVPGHYTPHA